MAIVPASCDGGGSGCEERADSGYILEMELTGFAESLVVEMGERVEEGRARVILGFFSEEREE